MSEGDGPPGDSAQEEPPPESGREELDLASLEPQPTTDLGPIVAAMPFRLLRHDPEPQREKIRGVLAVGLFALVAALALFAFVATAFDWLTSDELQALQPIFAALITLAGTALGFYFGGRQGR